MAETRTFMREKRFKIWDNYTHSWFEPRYRGDIGEISDIYINLNGEIILRQNDRLIHESVFPGRFKLVQYIGLHDSKGSMLYEGDIFSTQQFFGHMDIRYLQTISWNSNIERRRLSDPKSAGYELPGEDFILVGNIFENPDYLISRDNY